MSPAEPALDTVVYVANAGDGTIGSYRLDRQHEALVPLATIEAAENVMPLAVSPDRRYLYAAIRSDPLRVLSYRIEASTGELTALGSGALYGSMAYIATDRTGRYLLAASYGGNLVSVSPIDDNGVAGDATQTLGTGSRAHAIQATPDNHHVIATNLGDDQLAQFYFADGALAPNEPAVAETAAGSGPRHFVFSPSGRFVYVLGEFDATVTTFALDADSGTLSRVGICQGLPESHGLAPGMPREEIPAGDDAPRIWAADLHITPDGRYLYLSERTSSTLSTLRANPETGELHFVGNQPTVQQPRGFGIDPTGRYLVAAGELSDHLSLYRIESASGGLTHLSDVATGHKTNWVEIVALERP
ncbi:beta-propeller fold lactonase family protein [uncultured Salinicola sp.]|uniref:lactonase family protein n=1 Tax=uncultured Salinicola sp. TaxID=1193542 RepID=UPI00261E903A|nr:beta-propeller fold lactonase family protein [uncultured Salinicola sp.]